MEKFQQVANTYTHTHTKVLHIEQQEVESHVFH